MSNHSFKLHRRGIRSSRSLIEFSVDRREYATGETYNPCRDYTTRIICLPWNIHGLVKARLTNIFIMDKLKKNKQWRSYSHRFRQLARKGSRGRDFADKCLAYAAVLHKKNLPIIYDSEHFSKLVGYSLSYIFSAAYVPNKFYRSFKVDKKHGNKRKIDEPLPSLKEIQKWILRKILDNIKPSKYAKGFVKGSSIRDNAKFHRDQSMIVTVDIKEFFPSINRTKVYWIFKRCGYSKSVAYLLTALCTKDDSLPQGAPTSPALSNLTSWRIDQRLGNYAVKNELRYTRYADDITFSGDIQPGQLIQFISKVVRDDGFLLNENKTRVLKAHQRQIVTGIVVNKKLQVSREKRRELRQAVHYIKKFGLKGHLDHKQIKKKNYLPHLLGKANFIRFVNPNDSDAAEAFEVLVPLI